MNWSGLVVDRIEQEIREILVKLGASFHDDLSEYHKGDWCPMQEPFARKDTARDAILPGEQMTRLKIK
jgi:hypothetical protein